MVTCRLSPDRPNIYYEVVRRTDMEQDMYPFVEELRKVKFQMQRVFAYRSLNLCSMCFYFLTHLGAENYYPTGATEISDNRLFGMLHVQLHNITKM